MVFTQCSKSCKSIFLVLLLLPSGGGGVGGGGLNCILLLACLLFLRHMTALIGIAGPLSLYLSLSLNPKLTYTVRKMGLILRSTERIPKMQFSMARKFILHTQI
jgi:hypothetical protein